MNRKLACYFFHLVRMKRDVNKSRRYIAWEWINLSKVLCSHKIALHQLCTKRGYCNGFVIHFVVGISCSPGWRQSCESSLRVEIKMMFIISIILFYMLTPSKATTITATATTTSGRNIVQFMRDTRLGVRIGL